MARKRATKDKRTCNLQEDLSKFNTDRVIAIRMTMQPQHTNGRGKIFGGRLLELMDLAGAYGAHRVCKDRFIPDMVTRVINVVEFKQPVEVNDAVTFYVSVVKVGTTSVTVKVDVEADRQGTVIPVNTCEMVFVAVDANNKPYAIRDGGCEPNVAPALSNEPAADTTSEAKTTEDKSEDSGKQGKCKCKCKKCKKGKCHKCKCKKCKCKNCTCNKGKAKNS